MKWNDFQENMSTAIGSLRVDSDLTDVTLACEDGHQLQAHKVILAASSPFFQDIFKLNKHAYPLIYMRGIKPEELEAIMDFLYYGEANIFQENLETFLIIAQELSLKGLSKKEILETKEDSETDQKPIIPCQTSTVKKELDIFSDVSSFTSENYYPLNQMKAERRVPLPKQEFNEEMQEKTNKVKSMMVLSGRLAKDGMHKSYICQVCQKEGRCLNIKKHIENKHIKGTCIPCNLCKETFLSSYALKQHKCNEEMKNPANATLKLVVQ